MALQRAETFVIDGAIRNNFAIRIGMKEFISRKFQDGIWVSKDRINSRTTKKGQAIFLHRCGKDGTIYEYLDSPWKTIKKMWSELRVARQVCYRYEINNTNRRTHPTSADGVMWHDKLARC